MLFISCGDAYKDMVEEFDEKLRPEPKKETSIEDSNFVEDTMLQASYVLEKGSTFSLSAPAGGTAYKWELVKTYSDSTQNKTETAGTARAITLTSSKFDSRAASNQLVLTVTDANGKEYKDTATIILKINI